MIKEGIRTERRRLQDQHRFIGVGSMRELADQLPFKHPRIGGGLVRAAVFVSALAVAALCLASPAMEQTVSASRTEASAVADIRGRNNEVGQLYRAGKYHVALQHAWTTLELAVQLLGERHPDTLVSLDTYASMLAATGRPSEALPYSQRALRLRAEVLGIRHPATLSSLNNRAFILHALGRSDEALHDLQRSLELATEVVGERNRDTLTSLANYAEMLQSLGRSNEALPVAERALKLRTEEFGERDPSTLASLDTYAHVLESLGRTDEALPLCMRALTLRTEILGERHPYTLTSLNNCAYLLKALGRAREALPYLHRALTLNAEILGKQHPFTLSSLHNYAAVLESLGRIDEALPYHEQAMKLSSEVLGERHPDTLVSLNNYSMALIGVGRYRDALSITERSLQLSREVHGERHPHTINVYGNYAVVLDALGRSREALPYAEQALRLSRELLGEKHPNTLIRLENYANLLLSLGLGIDALLNAEHALAASIEVLGERHPSSLHSLHSYAELLQALGRSSEALSHAERALKLRREVLGEQHPDTITSIAAYAEVLEDVGRTQEAVPYYASALRLRLAVLGERHPATLASLERFAHLINTIGRSGEALGYYEKAVKLSVEILGERHPDTLLTLSNYASTLNGLGRAREALPYCHRVLQLRSEVLGEGHPQTIQSFNAYATTLTELGLGDEALPYFDRYVTGVEALREEAGRESVEQQRITFAQMLVGYHNYLFALNRANRLTEALALSERTKARTLLESMVLTSALDGAGLPQADVERLKSLELRLGVLDGRIKKTERDIEREALKSARDAGGRELSELKRRLRTEYPKYRELVEVHFATVEDAHRLPSDALFVSYIRTRLGAVAALTLTHSGEIHWHDLPNLVGLEDTVEALRLWSANLDQPEMLDDTGQRVRIVRWDEEQHSRWRAVRESRVCNADELAHERRRVSDAVRGARGGIDPGAPALEASGSAPDCLPPEARIVGSPAHYAELTAYLGSKLLMPLTQRLQGRTQLIISPDGPLGLIPWDVLQLQGRPLIEDFDIYQVQSLSVYKLTTQRKTAYGDGSPRLGLLALGDPAYEQQTGAVAKRSSPLSSAGTSRILAQRKWPDLRYAGAEMQQALQLFKDQGAIGFRRERATERTLNELSRKGELARYRNLLFSAHGYFDPNDPTQISLVLRGEGDDPKNDGYVTLAEWMGMTLKSDLTLVSACNTARGRNVSGEGLLGLGYALYIAGNTNAVLTLWPVNDQATAEFIGRFLRHVREGLPHAKALAATKREFLNHQNPQLRSPYFWAPFVLYGA